MYKLNNSETTPLNTQYQKNRYVDLSKLIKNIYENVDKKYLGDLNESFIDNKYNQSNFEIRNEKNLFNTKYDFLDGNKYSADDKILQFCYLFGIYDNFNDVYNNLITFKNTHNTFTDKSLIEMFFIYAEEISKTEILKFKTVHNSIRRRNYQLVNLEQQNYLNKFQISYKERLGSIFGHNMEAKLTKNERKLVLYFRDFVNGGIFQDTFDFLLICYTLDKYVSLGHSKLFTNIIITSRSRNRYPKITDNLFPNLKYIFKDNKTEFESFNILCGVCSNTIHFNNGLPSEMKYGSIPLLSNAILEEPRKMNSIKFHSNGNSEENVNFVKLDINYEENNKYSSNILQNIKNKLKNKFYNKSKSSKYSLIKEVLRGVNKLEEVAIEQARIKLTQKEMKK